MILSTSQMKPTTFTILLAGGLLAPAQMTFAADNAAQVRVVPCDKPVQSTKRGVCVNKMDANDFMALSPGVSWWYNWHYEDTLNPPKAANMEYIPMVWGARPDSLTGLKAQIAKSKPKRIFALNEPNLKGQAFITPEETASWYKKVLDIATPQGIPVVGPHMALGSSDNDSIKAFDPVQKKDLTYTYMVPFVHAFSHFMEKAPVSAVAAHSYGNFGELNWMTGMLYQEYKKPVWITEFAQWNAADMDAERDYLIQSVDLFERTPHVEGYAWFKERADNPKISLLEKESGKLNILGQTYVNMPVHDPNVYYLLPGRLQAESHLQASKSNIALTGDADGFLEMQAEGNSYLDYNVAVPQEGIYTLKIRCKTQEGTRFDLLAGAKTLGSGTTKAAGWQTVETEVPLTAGNQTIRLQLSAYARLNWLELGKK